MAVIYDNSISARSVNQASFGQTLNINLSSLPNAAIAVLVWAQTNTSFAGITVSGAGVGSYTLVPGTNIIANSQVQVQIYSGVAPSSASQTVTVGGMPATGNWGFTVITVTGADQTTPLINGTGTAGTNVTSISTTVVTAVGHYVVNVLATSVSQLSINGDATQVQLYQTMFGSGDLAGISVDAVVSGMSATVGWTTTGHGDMANAAADFQPAVPTVAAFAFSDTMVPQYQIRTTRVMV